MTQFKGWHKQVALLFFLLSGYLLQGCQKDCDPTSKPLLTEKEKSFFPNQPGDTLYFKDESGKKCFLVCKSKNMEPHTYIPTGHENTTCKSIYETWDRLTAKFEGNVLTDYGDPLFLETRLEGGFDPNDPGIQLPCQSDYKSSVYFFFNLNRPKTYEQIYLGKTDADLFPILINFNFIPEITLGGQQFRKLNATSISSDCGSYKPFTSGGIINSPLGLDSIYYSAQYGLIRLTTVGGKKYQRVL